MNTTRGKKLRAAVALLDQVEKLESKLARMFLYEAAPAKNRVARIAKTKPTNGRSKTTLTPAQQKARSQHGHYLGAIRHLPLKDRLAVKKARQANGLPAAMKLAKSLRKEA